MSVKCGLQCKAPLTHVIEIIPNGGDSASGDMWQCLGALFMVTVGFRKLLLSSEQKLGLLSNILQDTDHPPAATNYPSPRCQFVLTLRNSSRSKMTFVFCDKKCITYLWKRRQDGSSCILPIEKNKFWDVVMGPHPLTDGLSIYHYLYTLHYGMMWAWGPLQVP